MLIQLLNLQEDKLIYLRQIGAPYRWWKLIFWSRFKSRFKSMLKDHMGMKLKPCGWRFTKTIWILKIQFFNFHTCLLAWSTKNWETFLLKEICWDNLKMEAFIQRLSSCRWSSEPLYFSLGSKSMSTGRSNLISANKTSDLMTEERVKPI